MTRLPEGAVKVSALDMIKLLLPDLSASELDKLDIMLWSEISSRDSEYFGLNEDPDCEQDVS